MKPTAIDKALMLLDLLIDHPEGLWPADLIRQTGYPEGTLHRCLGILARNGFVRQDPSTGRYLLGYKFLRAYSGIIGGLDLPAKSIPHLKKLAQATASKTNLGVLRGNQLLFAECIVPDNAAFIPYSPPGTLAPPHTTAMGKVLLAYGSDADLQEYLITSPLAPRTPNTIATARELTEQLALVRERGYAIDDEEYRLGVRCLAAPVRDYREQAIAAVSVSMPIHELPWERVPAIAALMVETAQAISADLGYGPHLGDPMLLPSPAGSVPSGRRGPER